MLNVSTNGQLVKNGQFDAKLLIRRLRRKFPTVKFYIGDCPWCKEAKAVYIKVDNPDHINGKGLCNSWNRETYGTLKEFDEYLVKKQLKASWYSDNFSWSKIFITPADFKGYYAYYGKLLPERVQEPLSEENQKLTDGIIKTYKKFGIDATVPGGFYHSGDRNEIEYIYDNMTIRNYVMKDSFFTNRNRSKESQIKENLLRFKLTMERWEPQIRKIYNYYKNMAVGHFWMMEGGGGELQMFYGDDEGYVGCLHLDLLNEPNPKVKPTFAINNSNADPKFKFFKEKDIRILTYKKLWGNVRF